jgi:hypothetical protein
MARTSRFFKTPLQGNDACRVPALAMPSPSSTMPCQADEDKQHQNIPNNSVEVVDGEMIVFRSHVTAGIVPAKFWSAT